MQKITVKNEKVNKKPMFIRLGQCLQKLRVEIVQLSFLFKGGKVLIQF
jgi:hypothetical protein